MANRALIAATLLSSIVLIALAHWQHHEAVLAAQNAPVWHPVLDADGNTVRYSQR